MLYLPDFQNFSAVPSNVVPTEQHQYEDFQVYDYYLVDPAVIYHAVQSGVSSMLKQKTVCSNDCNVEIPVLTIATYVQHRLPIYRRKSGDSTHCE